MQSHIFNLKASLCQAYAKQLDWIFQFGVVTCQPAFIVLLSPGCTEACLLLLHHSLKVQHLSWEGGHCNELVTINKIYHKPQTRSGPGGFRSLSLRATFNQYTPFFLSCHIFSMCFCVKLQLFLLFSTDLLVKVTNAINWNHCDDIGYLRYISDSNNSV